MDKDDVQNSFKTLWIFCSFVLVPNRWTWGSFSISVFPSKNWIFFRQENWQVKWWEIITNEQVLEIIGEKRTLQNNIICRKAYLSYSEKKFPLKDRWMKWKEYEEEEHSSLMIWETEDNIRSLRRKLMIEIDGETTVYQSNIRKKYKLSSISTWTY